jgi:hypothetical protein
VALQYDGGYALYLNGQRVFRTIGNEISVNTPNIPIQIGYNYSGYITNLRIVKGQALGGFNSSTYPVPTSRLTNVGNTLLRVLQDDNFNDLSSTPKTITKIGNPVRYIDYPYAAPNTGEIIVTGSGDKTIHVTNNNLNIITNNSPFTHTSNANGTGELQIECFGSTKILNTIRTGNGNFSKSIVVINGSLKANTILLSGTSSYRNYVQGNFIQNDTITEMIFEYLGIANSTVSGGLHPYWTANNSLNFGNNYGWLIDGQASTSFAGNFFLFFG